MWLKDFRTKLGLSQKKVADICGISQQYYAFIESGERGSKLPVPTAKKIAAALGFDWTEFYNEKNAHGVAGVIFSGRGWI